MSVVIRQVDYYTVEAPDVPGEGFRILSSLLQSGVSLAAYCGFPVAGGRSQIDFVPRDPRAFPNAAAGLGVKFSGPKRAFLAQGQEQMGEILDVVGRLSNEEINIVGVQAVCSGSGPWGMLVWVKPAMVEKAARALGL